MNTGPNIDTCPNSLIATAGVVPASSVNGIAPIGPGGWSPRLLTNGEATPMAIGQVCYLSAVNTARLAQSDGTEAQATAVCVCIEAVAAGAVGRFVFGGALDGAGAGHVAGEAAFLSTVFGAIVSAPNVTAGQYNTYLGYWLNATDLQIDTELPILN